MKPIPVDQWSAALSRARDDMNGQPLNIHRLMANNPDLLSAWWPLRMHSVTAADLSARDRELITLRIAALTETWYEWAAHVDRGLAAGLTRTEIDRVVAGPDAAEWSESDAVLLLAVDELFERQEISAPTLASLQQQFSPAQILDIINLQGIYVNLACMIRTWGLDLEDWLSQRLPDDVTEASFRALLAAHRD